MMILCCKILESCCGASNWLRFVVKKSSSFQDLVRVYDASSSGFSRYCSVQ